MIQNLRKFLAEPLFGHDLRKDVTTGTGLSTPQAGLTHYDYTDGPHSYVGKAEKCEKCGCAEGDQIHKLQKGGPGSGPHPGGGVPAHVKARMEGEKRAQQEGQWQRLMSASRGKKAEVVAGMSKEEAQSHLARLNAAPGDDPAARKALEEKVKA